MLQLTIADIPQKNRLREYNDIFRKTLLEAIIFAELELIKKDGSNISTDLKSALLPNGFYLWQLQGSHQLIEGIINSIPVRVFWKDKNLVYKGCN